ncbi:MAG: hypothetical protein AB1489_26980 [Acidobacteriota bacterium]
MKRCPLCDKIWGVEKVFCPWDGYRLKSLDDSLPRTTTKMDDGSDVAVEPQFELFAENKIDENSLPGRSDFKITETQSLLDVALSALQQKRERDQRQIRDQKMKLFEEFNLYCRTLQYFVDNLKSQSDTFTYRVEYKDDSQEMWFRFTLSFGEGAYLRNFPVTITYYREPRALIGIDVNLYEIGLDKDSRHLRTEKAGGKVEKTISGYRYLIQGPPKMDGVELLKWLENSFKAIFRLSYSD